MEDVHLLIRAHVGHGFLWGYIRVDETVRKQLLFRKKIFEAAQVGDAMLSELRFFESPAVWWTHETSDLPVYVKDQSPAWYRESFYGVCFYAPQCPDTTAVVYNEGVGITSEEFLFFGTHGPSGFRFQTEPLEWENLNPPELNYGKVIPLFDPTR
jgi:hypothetical protein